MMEEVYLRTEDEYIKLGQLLKKEGIVQIGSDAKDLLSDGKIKVNGEIEKRRGRKLYKGDEITGDGWSFRVEK